MIRQKHAHFSAADADQYFTTVVVKIVRAHSTDRPFFGSHTPGFQIEKRSFGT